jgi:nuclear pore complex protein Nup188
LSADTSTNPSSSTIERFLSSPDVLELLSHPFKAFPKPSQQTKSAFETKTSAINVTPSPTARYDIKEIKEDALWLSKEAGIDEVSALRVVVVEWQTRTNAQLLDPFSTEELLGIQDAAGHSQSSLPVALLSQGADSKALGEAFDSSDSRRLRILYTYLSESRHLLKCINILLQKSVLEQRQSSENGKGKTREDAVRILIEIGQSLARSAPGESQEFLLECIEGVEASIKKVDSGSGWYKEVGGREEVELEWVNSQITEATLIMEIIFQTIDISEAIASSVTVLSWLRLTTSYNFFDGFDSVRLPLPLSIHIRDLTFKHRSTRLPKL